MLRPATLLAVVFCLGSILGAEDKVVVTDPALPDPDFAVQGEYLGQSFDDFGWCSWTGLQVVALGKGEFSAMEYRGGLPGHGWDGLTRLALTGKRDDKGITLTSKCRTYVITSDGAGGYSATSCGHVTLKKIQRHSGTLGARPPCGARVLFDGTSLSEFSKAKLTSDGLLMVGTETTKPVGDFVLHMEFRVPYSPTARGQGRGNSGIYIQGRYEVQILDSFGLEGLNNECGGLYKTRAPDVNMCLPPLTWQTYDIGFQAARYLTPCATATASPGKSTTGTTPTASSPIKVCPARITVSHNGVFIHQNVEIPGPTGAGQPESPDPQPIKLQDHGNPVHFRNIWIIDGR